MSQSPAPQKPKLTAGLIRGMFQLLGRPRVEIPEFVPKPAVRKEIRKLEIDALKKLTALPPGGTPPPKRYGKTSFASRLADKSIALRKDRERRAAIAKQAPELVADVGVVKPSFE